MESLFYRYRNILLLLVALFGQILLLAWQVKSDNDVPLVRIWAVSAVTPVASALENARHGTTGFFSNYFELRDAREESGRLRTERDRLKVENQILKDELSAAQRAQAMAGFQARTPSKMIGARVIGEASGNNTRSVLIDRGTTSGVRRGMAVVTPDGIVGKVLAVYLTASQVLAVTDPAFAAGVESQKTHVRGVMKGVGSSGARVDYIGSGQKVEVGEMFFTSGEDRIFPRGLPAGKVVSVQDTANYQEVAIEPSWTTLAPEEVLVILDVVHQEIPATPSSEAPVYLGPDVTTTADTDVRGRGTPANTLMDQYKRIGDAQKHVFGEGPPGSTPPNFNLNPNAVPAAAPAKPPSATGAPPVTPAVTPTGAQPGTAPVPRATPPVTQTGSAQPGTAPAAPRVTPPVTQTESAQPGTAPAALPAVKPVVKPPDTQPAQPPAAQPVVKPPPPIPPRQ